MQKLYKSTEAQLTANAKFPQFKGEVTVGGGRYCAAVWVYEDSMSIAFTNANANEEKIYPDNNPDEDYGVRMTMVTEHGNPYGYATVNIDKAYQKDPEGMKAKGYVLFEKDGKFYAGKRKNNAQKT